MDDYMDPKSDPTAAPTVVRKAKNPEKGAAEVTEERNSTHGDWREQSHTGHALKLTMRDGENWHKMHPSQKEALDMIQTKVSRILTGDPNEPDHWADIEGYAYLARKEIERAD